MTPKQVERGQRRASESQSGAAYRIKKCQKMTIRVGRWEKKNKEKEKRSRWDFDAMPIAKSDKWRALNSLIKGPKYLFDRVVLIGKVGMKVPISSV